MRQFINIVENATSFDPLEDSPTTASQMLIYDLFHDGELYGENAGMSLVPIDGYTVYLSRVWSVEQGKGHGGRLLKSLCAKADELNVTIELEVSPDRDSIMDAESLYDWYSRHGFETDFIKSSQQGAAIMVREPSLAEDIIAEGKSTPAERFISKAEETLDSNVRISLYPEDDYDVSIQKISVHPYDRGQGLASKALQYLGKMADRRGITLYLEALPDDDDENMDQDPQRLIRFYQRNGFSGGETDGMMWRSPKTKIVEGVEENLFIRFGDLPEDGRSKVGSGTHPLALWGREDTENEAGISVWETEKNQETGRWIIHATNYASLGELFAQNRPIYLVSGEYIEETGADGEPLITDAKIIQTLSPKEVEVPGWSEDDWIPDENVYDDPLVKFYATLNRNSSIRERGDYVLLNYSGEHIFGGQILGFGDIAERLEIKNSIPQNGEITDLEGNAWRAYWNGDGDESNVPAILKRFGPKWAFAKSMMLYKK